MNLTANFCRELETTLINYRSSFCERKSLLTYIMLATDSFTCFAERKVLKGYTDLKPREILCIVEPCCCLYTPGPVLHFYCLLNMVDWFHGDEISWNYLSHKLIIPEEGSVLWQRARISRLCRVILRCKWLLTKCDHPKLSIPILGKNS